MKMTESQANGTDKISPSGSSMLRRIAACLFFAALTFGVFSPLLKAPFLGDDLSVILGDSAPDAGLLATADERTRIDDTPLFRDILLKPRPLRQLSHRLDRMIAGESALWPHAENILLHLAVAAVACLLLVRRFGMSPAAACAAITIFLLNPVTVESLGVVSHRKEMLSALFLLLGLNAALGDASRLSPCALVCFVLAAAGKETALLAPAFFAIAAFWTKPDGMDRNGRLRLVRVCASYLLFAVLCAMLICWQVDASMKFAGGNPAQANARTGVFMRGAGFMQSILAAIRALPRDLLLMAVPAGHAPILAFATDVTPFSAESISAILCAAAFCATLIALAIRHDKAALPMAFLAVALCPYLLPPAIRLGYVSVVADRYLYLPSLAFAWLTAEIFSRLPKTAAVAAVATTTALYGFVSFSLAGNYASSTTYWDFAVRTNPDSPVALHNRAWSYWEKGHDPGAASRAFKRLLKKTPDFIPGYCSYAQILAEKSDFTAAVEVLDEGMEHVGECLDLVRLKAIISVLSQQDDSEYTAELFKRAEALGADDPPFHYGYAAALFAIQDWPAAARHYIAAGRLSAFAEEAASAWLLTANPPLRPGGTILFAGDSVPHGTGTDSDGGPALSLAIAVSNALKRAAIDATIPGSSANALPNLVDGKLKTPNQNISICVILSGHNDAINGHAAQEITAALAETAWRCRLAGTIPVIVGPISVRNEEKRNRSRQDAVLKVLDRKLKTFCASAGIDYLPAREALGDNNPSAPSFAFYDSASGNHLSRKGIERLTSRLVPILSNLSLPDLKSLPLQTP